MATRRTFRSNRLPLRFLDLESRIAPATFTVTNANNSGSGSLRQAVINANNTSAADLIDFSSFFNTPRTITLASQISITRAVTIDGTSAANVTVSGNNAVGVFRCDTAPTGTAIGFVDLTLKSGRFGQGGAILGDDQALTVTRCVLTSNLAENNGGAIFNGGPLTVTESVFTGNTAPGAGGAIAISGGSLTATNCVFTSNWVSGNGGAINVDGGGSLTATDCTFTSNTAEYAGGAMAVAGSGASTVLSRCQISNNYAGFGGGLSIFGNLILEASTVSGNQAVGVVWGGYSYPGAGGGIYASGPSTIRNSTICGNSGGSGGGIENGGTVVVQNCTITGNVATDWLGAGGGISRGTIWLESSIVASNIGFSGPDIGAFTVNAKNSSIFNRSGITVFNDLGGNRPEGENPRLGALQDNGGPTWTRLLLPGSPCLNAGSNPANLTTDQRGAGFPRVLAGTSDMGAAEGVDVNPTVTLISLPSMVTAPGGTIYTVMVRYDDDIGIDLATLDLSDISVTGPGYAVLQTPTALSISGAGTVVTVTYTLPAPGGRFDFFDGGLYTVAMAANQVRDIDTPVQHFVAASTLGTFRVSIPGTLLVDEPSDIDDGNTSAGHLSLREAVRLTNAAEGTADTINFDPVVFGSPRTITLTSGQFAVTDPLTLVGPGAGLLTLDAANTSRHFDTYLPNWGPLASLSGLTLINGRTTGDGGAIRAIGWLALSSIVIANGEAVSGGGVHVQGSLTMFDSTVSNCSSSNSGGGVFFSTQAGGPLLIERCSIVNNQAGGDGGGIITYVLGAVQISDSIFSGNQSNTQSSGLGGGGIGMFGGIASSSFIRNCTISGNVASLGNWGGGLALYIDINLPIANSTITGNSTTGPGGGIAVNNGYYSAGIISLNSTIIAGNSAGSGADLYFNQSSPTTVPGDNNLIGVANAGNFALTGTGNLTGTLAAPLNPMLGPLANNGGPTQTHALLPGSPAINAGNNASALAYDQRGPGFFRTVGIADIGAFEVQAPRVASVLVNDGAAQRSRVMSLSVAFSTQVTFAGQVKDAFTLLRNGAKAVSFTAAASIVNGVTVVRLSNFSGAMTQFGSLADGRYTLTALASQISAGGVALDGDGDGQPGGNYTFGDAQGLFRMYGDINGDRRVDGFDFSAFSSTYNLNSAHPNFLALFDINGDGVIDGFDFSQFSGRFNSLLP